MAGLDKDRTSHITSMMRVATIAADRSTDLDREARDLIVRINAFIKRQDWNAAARWADRLWRLTKNLELVGLTYGQLLRLNGSLVDALSMLENLARLGPDPSVEALVIDLLLEMRRTGDASWRLASALQLFAVTPGDPLSESARRLCADPDAMALGWVGLTPALQVHAECTVPGVQPQLEDPTGKSILPIVDSAIRGADGRRAYRWLLSDVGSLRNLRVTVGGLPLIGSDLPFPPDFGFDGRARYSNGRIEGWGRLGWSPESEIRVRVTDESGKQVSVAAKSSGAKAGRLPFALSLRKRGLAGDAFRIEALSPNGIAEEFPDSPVIARLAKSGPAKGPRPAAKGLPVGRKRKVDVVIPVYGDFDATKACIDSVIASRTGDFDIVVIDDASPFAELTDHLNRLAAAGAITLLRHESNLGFAAAANRGLGLHAGRDVVLLNADTLVFGDWLGRLKAVAYSRHDVATVTPMTNNGTIASYPSGGDFEFSPDEARAMDRLAAASAKSNGPIEIPVGVGFCLYLRRDCLDRIGRFDGVTFGKGYGEESDYCMRARRAGWRNLLAPGVFVHHRGGRSFGKRREALLERGGRLIEQRHPHYHATIHKFIAADPVKLLRRRLDERRLMAANTRYALVVTLKLTGGVDHFVAERCKAIEESGLTPLILVPHRDKAGMCDLRTRDGAFRDLAYAIPSELSIFRKLLAALPIDTIELHHFLGHDPAVIAAVRGLGIPYDVYVHDYIWICPRVSLLGGDGRYCGEPRVEVCERCVKKNGGELDENISVENLRRRSNDWLGAARNVFVPTADTAKRLRRYFPALTTTVLSWEEPRLRTNPVTGRHERIRIAVIGAIGEHKGYDVLLDCARHAAARDLPLEFVVLGYTQNDKPLLATNRVFVTGSYDEAEIDSLIARERPDLALFPSVWPETWCFALSHALRAGLPIVAFDIGAIAERLRSEPDAELLPLGASAAKIDRTLMELSRRYRKQSLRNRDILIFDNHETEQLDEAIGMARKKPLKKVVKSVETAAKSGEAEKPAVTASLQMIALPEGLYTLRVKSGPATAVAESSGIALPAVHIAAGPGVSPEAVQFILGPRSRGTWLSQQGDSFMVRIAGPQAPLVMSSIRGPGGELLEIGIEPTSANAARVMPVPNELADNENRSSAPARPSLRLQVDAHIRNRGDMRFVDAPWTGRVGRGLWIESFALTPLERLATEDLEYKGLTASGFETPWVSNAAMCGTRAMSVPLIGFAIRAKARAGAPIYDCEYSGYFQTGAIVGPIRNGAPCRSTVANDPLEGIQIRIVERAARAVVPQNDKAPAVAKAAKPIARSLIRKTIRAAQKARKPARAS
jgi:GT2 family glycosyltransferase